MSASLTKDGVRTYRVTVDVQRHDEFTDRAVVTVNGTPYRYPYHWEDNLRSLARRAVEDNYRAETFGPVMDDRRKGRGSYIVTARVW